MGVVSDTYGCLLCPILMKLIPEELTLDYSRHKDEDLEWNVEELMRFIQKEVESRERTDSMTKYENTKEQERGESARSAQSAPGRNGMDPQRLLLTHGSYEYGNRRCQQQQLFIL
ncbi:hypothetical protein DPEC_G00000270 [Dallia pectoralis]|uniref:Uncharacterized protein n=1 Tax=Dallia pectoralis TaxID=75939 RepID=A0ACC2HJF6_DALPE|nr:hypothetical protein DPEC_G00000270 [Dallia pectoralis]